MAENKRDWITILKIVLESAWDGAIEAGKAAGGPLYAGPLGFLRKLHMELGKTSPQERSDFALGVKRADLADIKNIIEDVGIKQQDQIDILNRILSGVAENTAMIDGFAPAYEDILNAVNRLDSLPEIVLNEVRNELSSLGRKIDSVQMDIEAVPPIVRRDRLSDEELQNLKEKESFEMEYLKFIREEYGYIQILGISSYAQRQPINAAFISLSLTGSGESGEPRPAEGVLRDEPCLIVEGEAGAGKTTLLQWEAVRCCDQKRICREEPTEKRSFCGTTGKEKRIIPFFIRLRRRVRKEDDFPVIPDEGDWIRFSISHFTMEPPKNWLHSVLTDGRALLILDGLDELPPDKRPKFWTELQNLFNQYKNLKFRVSSRYFPRDNERSEQWQPPRNPLTGQTVPTFKVEPLSPDKIDHLIEQWHKAMIEGEPTPEFKDKKSKELEGYPEKLKAKLRESQYRRIFELAETPFLCAAICLINSHRRQVLPKERHELYKMLIEALLSLRDKQREITTTFDDVSMEVLVYLHANLAWIMMGGMREPGETKESEETYLIEAREEDALKWLKDDMESKPTLRNKNPEDFLTEYLIPRCGLLRETSKGFLDFRHRALQEYLAGTAAMYLSQIDRLVYYANDDRWRDTIILAAGGYNVGKPEAVGLIRSLIERGVREKLNICFAVAVACLETASGKLDTQTYDLALEKLRKLIPPKNTQEAKTLSAAGDQAVPLLPYGEYKENNEIIAACAETLSLIGSDDARIQLGKGYLEDKRIPVVLQLLKCPGIDPLKIPAILDDVKETHSLSLPEYALEYIRDISSLSRFPNLYSLSLRGCDKITDISPVSRLENLEKLDLGYCTGIEDFSPLQDLPNLKSLDLQGIMIPKDFKLPKALPSKPNPGIDFLEITEGLYMKMVWIKGGDFLMGSPEGETGRYGDEGPVHRVHLDGFWMSTTPVTKKQYKTILKDNPSDFKGEHNPVEQVTWNDARKFCEKLSEKSGKNYSFPTEAQWEFACRAGSKGRFCFGDTDQELEHYAWYDKNSEGRTHPVGQKRPNSWGIFDMHGNVWEWCYDLYGEYKEGEFRNPKGPEKGKYRLRRGGSWVNESRYCRSAFRSNDAPGYSSSNLGFRVVLVLRT